MNYEILDALSQITREKSVDRQMLVETLEAGLASAVRKKHGATADVQVSFSNDTGAITVALRKTVVETVAVWRRTDESPLVKALLALMPMVA